MTAAPELSAGDTVANKYKLNRSLGEGGMGRVFLARHEMTGRRLALKLVPAADSVTRERMLREARTMGSLAHPNVVGVLDVGEWEGNVFIAMEYVHGKNLREFANGAALPVEQAAQLILPACAGVAAAHQAGILHRDLKPDNLFVCTDRDGTVLDTKVLDFGVAKLFAGGLGRADGSLTESGSIIGTPKYMAPEQLVEDPILDERTDVYAMGLILYEVLSGRLPYGTTSLRGVVLEILKGEFPELIAVQPSVPPGLSRVVMTALAGDVDDRPASVAELAKSLEPWAGGRSFVPPLAVHTPDTTRDSWLPTFPRQDERETNPPGSGPPTMREAPHSRHPDTQDESLASAVETTGGRGQRRIRLRKKARTRFTLTGALVLLMLAVWWWVRAPSFAVPHATPLEAAGAQPEPRPASGAAPQLGSPSVASERTPEPEPEVEPAAPPAPLEPAQSPTPKPTAGKRRAAPPRAPRPSRPSRPSREATPADPMPPTAAEPAPPTTPKAQRRTTDNRDPWAEDS